jgi:carbonic anhydrase
MSKDLTRGGDVAAGESVTDEFLRNNAEYAKTFPKPLPLRPAKHVAIVACMDSRMDIFGMLGLEIGEAHVIRNAGGVVTDDAMRSLLISQRLLGTNEIILIHHTNCGMVTFTDEELSAALAAETGHRPSYPLHAFDDLAEDVRAGIARIKADPHIPHRDRVRGFIFDIETGRLEEVF